jgi:hypothetical protein
MGKDKRRLAQSRAKKKEREAARKKRKRKQAGGGRFAHLGCTRAELEHSPVHSAYVTGEIFLHGIGHSIIARKMPDGRIAAGIFLLDVYCLGVKDAFLTVLPPEEFDEVIADRFRQSRLESASPAHARKLVDDAIAYARDLGFEPHRDFRDASVVLGDIDPSACTETFTFGKDGKPSFIAGPYESEARIRRVMAQLRSRCGPDGASFVIETDDPALLEELGLDGAIVEEDNEDWEEEVEEDGDEDEEGEEDEEADADAEDDEAREEDEAADDDKPHQ